MIKQGINAETYKPTKAMAAAARKALQIRDSQPESNKGMTMVGLTRARQLIASEALSLDTVKRMYSFFKRHEVDKQGEGWGKDSKGYQAWLGWGGDAGYNWAKQIVEKAQKAQNMTINQIMINSTVRKSQVVDNGNHWLIRGIPVTVDNAMMNGIKYPEDENAKGLPTINQKPITGGHPIREGYPISVNEDRQQWYIGSDVVKHYNSSGVNYVDVKASKKMMRNSENELGAYFADKLERKESFGVSTGLNLVPVTNEAGEVLATNQSYDHLAFLHDNERPAGGDNTMVKFNADAGVMVINIDDMLDRDDEDDEDDKTEDAAEKAMFKKLMKKIANAVFGDKEKTGYNSQEQFNNQEGDAMRETMLAAMAANGLTVNSDISDADLLIKYNSMLAANAGKSDKETPAWAQALIQSNAEMKAKMDKMDSEAEAEKKKKVEAEAEEKKAYANKLGIEESEAAEMSVNTLRKLAGVQAPITANAAGGFQGKKEESIFGANYFQELEG